MKSVSGGRGNPLKPTVDVLSVVWNDVESVDIDVQTLRVGIPDTNGQCLRLYGIQQVEAQTLGVGACEEQLVVLVGSHYGVEGTDSLLAGVTKTPSMVLRSVDKIHIAVGVKGNGRDTTQLGVCIHTLYNHHHVIYTMALPGLPSVMPLTVIITDDT